MSRLCSRIAPSLGASIVSLALAPAAFASHLDDPPDPLVPIDDPIPGHIVNGAIEGQLDPSPRATV